jgi:hypothetical protein
MREDPVGHATHAAGIVFQARSIWFGRAVYAAGKVTAISAGRGVRIESGFRRIALPAGMGYSSPLSNDEEERPMRPRGRATESA